MLQTKKITLRVFALSLCCLTLVSSVFCVPVSAANEAIDLSDYLVSKDYTDDDVVVTYDFVGLSYETLRGRDNNNLWTLLGAGQHVSFFQNVGTESVSVHSDLISSSITLEAPLEDLASIRNYSGYKFLTSAHVLTGGVSNVLWNGVNYEVKLQRRYFPVRRVNSEDFFDVQVTYIGDPSIYDDSWPASDEKYPFFIASIDANGYDAGDNVFVYSTDAAGTHVSLKLQETIIIQEAFYDYNKIEFEHRFLSNTSSLSVIDVRDLTAGSSIALSFSFTGEYVYSGLQQITDKRVIFTWYDKNMQPLYNTPYVFDFNVDEGFNAQQFEVSLVVEVPSGAEYFRPYLYLSFLSDQLTSMDWNISSLTMTHSLSAFEDNSKTQQEVVHKLDVLDGKMDGVIDGLGSIEDVLEGTNDRLDDMNDKLDDTNDKLDELPGQIGDEIQDVIDKENDKHQSAGQEFVDQILDILPDSSTEIMGALKGLTDAMSYTGTEAVITIPGITMPAVGKLIPRTVLWDGVNMDFGEYVEMLPSLVLKLVRYLFTIAIVLYCAYELKGIVSYCLTLKESKGG